MKKIIVFGDLPIATEVCKFISNDSNSELIGVVIGNMNPNNNDPFEDNQLLYDYAVKNNIQIYTISELLETYEKNFFDLGISARFSKIIKKRCLDLFKLGIINFHGGLLPEYGGLYSSVHCLLNGETIGGGTIHWMEEGIDTGDIIARCKFNIDKHDTAYDVFQKTQLELLKHFKMVYTKILDNCIHTISQDQLVRKGYKHRYFNKSSLDKQREIDILKLVSKDKNLQEKEINKIRAFSFKGYESAYTIIDNHKVYLNVY